MKNIRGSNQPGGQTSADIKLTIRPYNKKRTAIHYTRKGYFASVSIATALHYLLKHPSKPFADFFHLPTEWIGVWVHSPLQCCTCSKKRVCYEEQIAQNTNLFY